MGRWCDILLEFVSRIVHLAESRFTPVQLSRRQVRSSGEMRSGESEEDTFRVHSFGSSSETLQVGSYSLLIPGSEKYRHSASSVQTDHLEMQAELHHLIVDQDFLRWVMQQLAHLIMDLQNSAQSFVSNASEAVSVGGAGVGIVESRLTSTGQNAQQKCYILMPVMVSEICLCLILLFS
ncbi:unnamed protein product [Protopolystoma xenopodis]|uniref:Uncharacterized protein n=1 Tax=Protopolystoma xenopodis TaxID=117903 RepID=A0A3S5BT07_9PLAT|nr:unnamed protein product [Protopolystoma xenopodis]